jgi:hypothetical protein
VGFRLSRDQLIHLQHQFSVIVLRVLFKRCDSYSGSISDMALQPRPRRPLSADMKTKQLPLRATTIDESSIHGNLMVHNDAYLVQLEKQPEDIAQYAILRINEQSQFVLHKRVKKK